MLPAKNSIELLHQINSEKLFIKLIEQLNKDLQLANITESFNLTVSILELKKGLSELLLKLISHKYDDYLNLLYRIDVPEKELATIKAASLDAKFIYGIIISGFIFFIPDFTLNKYK